MTVRSIEGTFNGPGTSDTLVELGKDMVNVVIVFSGVGMVAVDMSYDGGATWVASRMFTTSIDCSFRNHQSGVRARFRCAVIDGSVSCRMSSS